ncbi:hypothetical protein [Rahnella inusitata]|uniref:hypothetical protein n=1 Tax=Rahnella inusitata TaxID=58169 RepID=UPI0039BE00AC
MKLWRVTAKDHGYDEFDAFLIWASTPEEALKIAIDDRGPYQCNSNFLEDATIAEELPPTESVVALGSFNAW